MKSKTSGRRKFLGTLSATAAGGMFVNALSPLPGHSMGAGPDDNEYLIGPGITYLNTGTLGPCRRETMQASGRAWEMLEALPVRFYGRFGAEATAEKTRNVAARFLGCDVEEILITTSTTNGMNAVAQGLRLKAGDRVLTTDQEHGGGALCWEYFEKYYGVSIDRIIIPPGENSADAILMRIKDGIRSNTRAISISHIFSSTGLRAPVAEISSLARSKGILCIVDGAQSAGAIGVNVKQLGCHAYATSGHKWLMGPKGTGLLYLSKEAQESIRPMQFEGSHRTYNDGTGVVNAACILGLSTAIEYLESVGIARVEDHNLSLRARLYERLSELKNLVIVSPAAGPLASPMIACRIPESIERVSFVKMLFDKHNLSIRPTHPQWFNGIRFSMHIFNTETEVDFAADVIKKEIG